MVYHVKQALLICAILLSILEAAAQRPIKVACVGNSITEGYGLTKTYPEALQELLGTAFEVRNYGVSGRTLLKKGDFPYWNEAKYGEVLAWNPQIVIIKLGTNDTKPQNWIHKKRFVKDYKALIKSFHKLPTKPTVYLCTPIPVFEDKWGITQSIVEKEILPAMKKIARKRRVVLIDLYTPMLDKAALTYDGVHPNEDGAVFLAQEVMKALQPDAMAAHLK